MRNLLPLGALSLAACSTVPLEMTGFSDVAQRSEVVAVHGVGWGRSGNFTLAPLGVAGRFTRSADSYGADGALLAEGHVSFALAGESEFGGLTGECAYSRETLGQTDVLGRRTTLETTLVTGPYIYTCGFYRGDAEVGAFEMRERPGKVLDVRSLREGRAEVGAARMELASIHTFAGSSAPTEMPLGYRMNYANGEQAMLYTNGATRRIALPPTGRDERAAALLTGVALALVWEPGDVE